MFTILIPKYMFYFGKTCIWGWNKVSIMLVFSLFFTHFL